MYVKCWQCGEQIESNLYTLDEVNSAYDKGYMQAIRDVKSARMNREPCATTKNRIEYGD